MRNGGGGGKINLGKMHMMKSRETCKISFFIWSWKQNRVLGTKRRRRLRRRRRKRGEDCGEGRGGRREDCGEDGGGRGEDCGEGGGGRREDCGEGGGGRGGK